MKKIVLLILLSVILLCSSCVVSFENPISGAETKTVDSRLLGKWRAVEKEEALFEFAPDSNSETLLKFLHKEENNDRSMFRVSSVQLGKYNYLSLKLIEEEEETNIFLIVKYELVGDEMTVWMHDKEKIAQLLEQGKLKGGKKSYGEISISNSPEELRKFLESTESDELFEFFGKLKKQ